MSQQRAVLITGAARGIGFATAKVFAQKGDTVYLVDRNQELLGNAVDSLKEVGGGAKRGFVADISSDAAVSKLFESIGSPVADVVVNCAGISTSNLMIDISDEEWDRVMAVNTKGTFLVGKYGARRMIDAGLKDGRIINISSQASKIGERANGAYCASKAAVNMITQVMALELAPHGIKVTAIAPGYVHTEILEQVFRERGPIEGMSPKEYEQVLINKVPAGRLASPEDIAKLVRFLASDDADYITGVTITSAGGVTLI